MQTGLKNIWFHFIAKVCVNDVILALKLLLHSVDAVVFADPKQSLIDIVQAAGSQYHLRAPSKHNIVPRAAQHRSQKKSVNNLGKVAEGKGFEPPEGVSSFNDLANRRLQPLGHPSANFRA